VQVVVHDQGLRLLTQDGKLNPTASLLLNCLASISQIERQLIVDRTKAGVAAARAAGKYIGRKPGSVESDQRFLQKPKVKAIIPLLDEDYPVKYIAKIVGCSPQLVRKVRTRLEAKS
jgi:DNA invertase Pin-like site-specific DNA recombinase